MTKHPNVVRDRRLPLGREGMAALDFALVATPTILFLFGVVGLGIHFFLQQSLDYAVEDAARRVEIGQIGAAYSESDFVNKVICPNFLGTCSGLYVDLHPVIDYTSIANSTIDPPDSGSTQNFQFCPGAPGQAMYLHVILESASPLVSLFGFGTRGFDTMIGNAPFVNENPTGVAVTPASGCPQ